MGKELAKETRKGRSKRRSISDHMFLRILLVEDSLVDAFVIGRLLEENENHSCCVFHAEDMKHAEETIEKRDDFDIILLDLGLPDTKDAGETYERIEKIRGNIPVIIITNEQDHDLAVSIVDEGAEDFVRKDVVRHNSELLGDAIDFAICRSEHLAKFKEQKDSELEEKDKVIQWVTGSYSVMK